MPPRPKFKKRCKIIFKGEPYTKSNGMKTAINWKIKRPYVYYEAYIVEYEKALKDYATQCCDNLGLDVFAGPVRLKINYYLKARKVKDLQNLPKTTCDALIGSVYRDDNQVCEIIMRKLYDPVNPRGEIEVDEIITDNEHHRDLYPVAIKKGEVDSAFAEISGPRKAKKPRKKPSRASKSIQKASAKSIRKKAKPKRRTTAKRSRKTKKTS